MFVICILARAMPNVVGASVAAFFSFDASLVPLNFQRKKISTNTTLIYADAFELH